MNAAPSGPSAPSTCQCGDTPHATSPSPLRTSGDTSSQVIANDSTTKAATGRARSMFNPPQRACSRQREA